jgi:phenolic acid decarboxylase
MVGWAWTQVDKKPESDIALALHSVDSDQKYFFRAWRTARPDVAAVFNSDHLLMSGYRAYIDAPTGTYELTVIQQADETYTRDPGRANRNILSLGL